MKKTIIFASMVVATMIANVTAKAETVSTTKTDSNKVKSVNELSKLLANGQEKELKNFIDVQSPALATSKEVILVNKVLSLYNTNSSAFFNLNIKEKVEFNDAVAVLVKNLGEIKTIEATNWLSKVKYTQNTINFLWNVNQVEVLDINNDTNIDEVVTSL
jgi:hypothetical protein